MSSCRALFLVFTLLLPAALVAQYAPHPGNCGVGTYEAVWHDTARSRDVPVKIYYPTGANVPQVCPVIIFSHGLGGSRETYSYLGEAWASHGYISVHPQHHGSDTDILTQAKRPRKMAAALKRAASDPDNFVERPADIEFVIAQLSALNAASAFPLRGRLDLKHLAVAGHSFGAYTVMAVVGQAIGPANSARYFGPDTRIVSAIAMSSQPAAPDNVDHAYDRITIPVFHMTGTHDESIGRRRAAGDDGTLGHTSAAGRRVAFDHTKHAVAYLLTFQGGDHMVFSGREPNAESGPEARLRKTVGTSTTAALTPEKRDAMHRLVVDGSLAFWDATLRGDVTARQWLENGGFTRELGALGTFEQKHP